MLANLNACMVKYTHRRNVEALRRHFPSLCRTRTVAMSNLEFTPVRPCVKCGATERNAKGDCKACNRAKAKAWYAKNTERVRATQAEHHKANPQRRREVSAACYARNREKYQLRAADYVAANPEKIRARDAKYRATHPEANRLAQQNRRAKKKEAGGRLSRDLSTRLFSLQKGKCPCCNQPLGDDYHLDHITPLALGGSNTDDNIQLLRAICNQQKHAKHPVDFMQSRGFLL